MAYSFAYILFLLIFVTLSTSRSLEGVNITHLTLAGFAVILAFGSWCAYEAHKGQLEEMENR
ncbi:hypothetical protein GCM10007053_10390 [Halioglobus pacificus]|uniref:Uncharacterized protein n=1 Tax=Parahalioglobus pacificus TaxID=930806 RepID=A0A918XGD4_9GAMM|nr:hypothetical protein GCM10007053_10390 [Halioglobus pacificus]